MTSGYEQIYLDLLPRLSQCDLVESARRLGLEVLASGEVSANFCGRTFLISHQGVTPADGQSVNVNFRSVLAHYILSKGRAEPEHSVSPSIPNDRDARRPKDIRQRDDGQTSASRIRQRLRGVSIRSPPTRRGSPERF